MVITVECPSCASSFPVDPEKIPVGGVKARCTNCREVFRVERPSEPDQAQPAEPVADAAPAATEPPPEAHEPEPHEPEVEPPGRTAGPSDREIPQETEVADDAEPRATVDTEVEDAVETETEVTVDTEIEDAVATATEISDDTEPAEHVDSASPPETEPAESEEPESPPHAERIEDTGTADAAREDAGAGPAESEESDDEFPDDDWVFETEETGFQGASSTATPGADDSLATDADEEDWGGEVWRVEDEEEEEVDATDHGEGADVEDHEDVEIDASTVGGDSLTDDPFAIGGTLPQGTGESEAPVDQDEAAEPSPGGSGLEATPETPEDDRDDARGGTSDWGGTVTEDESDADDGPLGEEAGEDEGLPDPSTDFETGDDPLGAEAEVGTEIPGGKVPDAPTDGTAPATLEEPSEPVKGFTFGKRDPADKARRLARVLVSDMIMYNPERHQRALENGTLEEDFEDEISKSWKEYVSQVGDEMARESDYWTEALNDLLAKGKQVF